jgi:lipoprotein NlpI
MGDYEKAKECFYKSTLFDPDNQYSYLLYYLALHQSGKPHQAQIILKDFAANLKNDDWIAPVIFYYNGDVDEEAVLKDAWFASAEFDKGRKCEAYYYLGMAYLLTLRPEMKNAPDNLEKALDYFQKSVATNKQDYMEYELAWAELNRLSGETIR